MPAYTTDNPQLPRCSANFATEIKLHNIYQLYLGNQPSQSVTYKPTFLFVCLFVWSFIFLNSSTEWWSIERFGPVSSEGYHGFPWSSAVQVDLL